jgi:hypothetical protein
VLWVQLGLARAQCGGFGLFNSIVTYSYLSLQYINYALRKDRLEVGHSVNSSTTEICPVVIEPIPDFPRLAGHRLILVDTPGFDDTFVDDVEILKRIAKWLAAS